MCQVHGPNYDYDSPGIDAPVTGRIPRAATPETNTIWAAIERVAANVPAWIFVKPSQARAELFASNDPVVAAVERKESA